MSESRSRTVDMSKLRALVLPDEPDEDLGLLPTGQLPLPVQQEDVLRFAPDVQHVELRHDTMQHEYAMIGHRISEQGKVVARAIAEQGRADSDMKHTEARLFLLARSALRVELGKEPSATLVESQVRGDERYCREWLAAVNRRVDAEARKEKARTDLTSLITDRDMLIQAGSDRRKEMVPDLNLRNEVQERLRPPAPNAVEDE